MKTVSATGAADSASEAGETEDEDENETSIESTSDVATDFTTESDSDESTSDATTESDSDETDEASTDTSESGSDLGSWRIPTMVAELQSEYADDDPSLTTDMLEIYFESLRPGGPGEGDVWMSKRSHVSEPWEPPSLVTSLSSTGADTTLAITGDGLVFTVSRDGPSDAGDTDIYLSSRASRMDPWPKPVLVSDLSSPADDFRAALSADRTAAFLCRGTPASSEDIYISTRTSPMATWQPATLIPALSASGVSDCVPWLSEDPDVLYFVSVRDGGAGGTDIWMAPRVEPMWLFPDVTPVEELNTLGSDVDPWVAPGGRTVFFASDRDGSFNIYSSTR